MHKLLCKRGYKRYMDSCNNRMVLLVRDWYGGKLMIDFILNEQYIGHTTTEASWADIFSSDGSVLLISHLMKWNAKLKIYVPLFLSMKLFQEDYEFIDKQFQLSLYASVPVLQKASVKICSLSDSKEKRLLHQCDLNASTYQDVYDSCIRYLDGLDVVTGDIVKICGCDSKPLNTLGKIRISSHN